MKRAGDFAQALMDLGATICTPRSPNCQICPWADHCEGKALGIAESLPRKAPKAKSPPGSALPFGSSATTATFFCAKDRRRFCSVA